VLDRSGFSAYTVFLLVLLLPLILLFLLLLLLLLLLLFLLLLLLLFLYMLLFLLIAAADPVPALGHIPASSLAPPAALLLIHNKIQYLDNRKTT
jgi:hypothetical protein